MDQNEQSQDQPQQQVEEQFEMTPALEQESSQALTRDAKQWAMFCHLGGLAAYLPIPFGGVIAPLILWQLKKDEHVFIDANGKESLNWQISLLIYTVVSVLLMFVVIGIFLLIALGITNLVCIVIASIKANNGESFRYPLCIRFIK